jgi:PAS domain S-box-containing protein
VLGLTPQEIAGGSVDELMGPAYREQTRPRLERAFAGERVRWELELPPAPGRQRKRFFSVTYEPQEIDGEVSTVVVAVADVSERKHAEIEREEILAAERAARAETERAARLKDEFLATLSHELRTPLNAIVGWSHVLRHDGLDRAEIDQGLDVIERNARLQARLISDLLDMSRILSGRMRLEEQVVELKEMIRNAVQSVRPAADSKRIGIEEMFTSHELTVLGDPGRLQQIVWNLLSNSVKFTPED